jgi:predicted nucleic acid-binding protein
MVYFLDTDVVSNLRRQTPNRQLLDWLGITPKEDVRIPLVVIFEIQRGIETLRQEGKQVPTAEIETWLERLLDAAGYDGIVCPAVDDVRQQARMFAAPALRNFLLPQPRSTKLKFGGDVIVAAMAIVHRATIVSFDVDDYRQIHDHFPLPGLFHPGRNEWVIEPTD